MAMQPIDGIPQKQRVAIPRLVEALRGIHQRNPDITPASRHANSGGPPGHLARGGRDLDIPVGCGDASLRYSALRDHIKQLERQAERHSAADRSPAAPWRTCATSLIRCHIRRPCICSVSGVAAPPGVSAASIAAGTRWPSRWRRDRFPAMARSRDRRQSCRCSQ